VNYSKVKGLVSIGGVDFDYGSKIFIARGSFIYGHLSDSKQISVINIASRKDSPSPKTPVASDAIAFGVEAGLNIFSFIPKISDDGQKLYFFSRYEFYDPMYKVENGILKNDCWKRQQVSVGINYYPLKNIVIKAQYALRIFDDKYNNEPAISLGVAYSGMFKR